MQQILSQMLAKYDARTLDEKKNALKEVLQEVVLSGLARADFFKNVAFYGGTALRIFYGLDRFSEDLDFSLCKLEENFDLESYFTILENELNSLGLNFRVSEKEKTYQSNIKSAFLKGNTKEHILSFYENTQDIESVNSSELIKIKFEVDVNPPEFANFEIKTRLLPYPYQVKLYDMPSLFAGKIHACLCRNWQTRVKGRDFYDYIFFLSRNTKVNLLNLKARLVESNVLGKDAILTIEKVKEMLCERFKKIDFKQAKEDVYPFIKDKSKLDLWSADFFIEITQNLQAY